MIGIVIYALFFWLCYSWLMWPWIPRKNNTHTLNDVVMIFGPIVLLSLLWPLTIFVVLMETVFT